MSEQDAPRKRTDPLADLSHVALRLDDDEELTITQTGPLPASPAQPRPAVGEGVKFAVGGGSFVALMLAIDKAFASTGMTATDVVEHLGPALGVLYNSSPVVLVLLVFGWLVMRVWHRVQATNRRRDRRQQKAMEQFSLAIRGELVKLRTNVSELATALSDVRRDVEVKIDTAVTAAATAATHRADRIERDIHELRSGQADLRTRIAVVEARDPRSHPVPPDAPHSTLDPAPTMTRRPKRNP